MQVENLEMEDAIELLTFSETVARMKSAAGVEADIELAKTLDVPKGTLSSWRTRQKIPLDHLVNAAKKLRISLDSMVFKDAGLGSVREYALIIALDATDYCYFKMEMGNPWHAAFWRAKILLAAMKVFEFEISIKLQSKDSFGSAAEEVFGEWREEPRIFFDSILKELGGSGIADMLAFDDRKAFQ